MKLNGLICRPQGLPRFQVVNGRRSSGELMVMRLSAGVSAQSESGVYGSSCALMIQHQASSTQLRGTPSGCSWSGLTGLR